MTRPTVPPGAHDACVPVEVAGALLYALAGLRLWVARFEDDGDLDSWKALADAAIDAAVEHEIQPRLPDADPDTTTGAGRGASPSSTT